jgi:4-carboxymuconolactone decarboxylase
MTLSPPRGAILRDLDDATRSLVRLAAVVTQGSDLEIREAISSTARATPPAWIEELLLQTYLFGGFPRALNAMREWRRIHAEPVVSDVESDVRSNGGDEQELATWRAAGAMTCAVVYGAMYDRLRTNIRGLHPLLDDWMIVEGYGKVLSRPGLDLPRRELCIIAACAAADQERQLHAHLHGALNVGVPPSVIDRTIDALADLLDPSRVASITRLWGRVRKQ